MAVALKKILPCSVLEAIEKAGGFDKLFEIRLRANRAICVNSGGRIVYLNKGGICDSSREAYVASASLIKEVIIRATNHSLYAANEQLKTGFLSLEGGVRIGIAGEVVEDGGKVKTIKNFSGINIRIPHEVLGCGVAVYSKCLKDILHSTLIISPPGAGKTTILRDISRLLSQREKRVNVLIVDERCEIAASFGGAASMNVGEHSDVFALSPKAFAFSAGIRALAPDVIITDELASELDAKAVAVAVSAGVCVIASAHGRSLDDIKLKPGFKDLIEQKIFTKFVVLSTRLGAGTVEEII